MRKTCTSLVLLFAGFIVADPAHALEKQALPEILPAQGSVQVAFVPWDDAESLLISAILSARTQVLVQAFLITSSKIASSLIDVQQRGIDVRVLADGRQHEQGARSLLGLLAKNGIPVRLEKRYQHAHNKIVLIDATGTQAVVATGSFNFTWSAQNVNAENLLILRDNPLLAQRYAQNWERHWQQATPFHGPQ